MRATEVHFENNAPFEEIPATPKQGDVVWVNYFPNPQVKGEFMSLPVTCTKVYDDGSWDGRIEEGEA